MKRSWFCLLLTIFIWSSCAPAALAQQSATVSTALNTPSLVRGKESIIAVVLDVKAGLHAQSHVPKDDTSIPCVVTMTEDTKVKFGEPLYPPGQNKSYPALGEVNIYTGKVVIRVPVTANQNAGLGKVTIAGSVNLQACNDNSCFPPEDIAFTVESEITDAPAAPTTVPTTQADLFSGPSVSASSGTDRSVIAAYSLAFLIGIIFNAMPCVLPVVPLKIMGFYEVSQHNRAKSVALGAVFSAGLIASFAVLALLVVGLRTLQWGGLFQQTWFTIAIVAVLFVMAVSMLGIFTVNLPSTVYRFTPRHDTYVGNFLFGILTAALSTPCTFGMFVGLLTWALAQQASVGCGAIIMVGVGMAFPYFILSAVPEVARNFPRTGPWAEVIKQMMAFLLLGTAVYFAQPVFENYVNERAFWWTLFAVVAAGAMFLFVRSIQFSSTMQPRIIGAGVGLAILVPALWATLRLTSNPFDWKAYSNEAVMSATSKGSPVLIDFTATWCGNCHFIEGYVLKDPRVVKAIKDKKVVMVKADITDKTAAGIPLLHKLSTTGSVPLTAVYPPNSTTPKLLDGLYNADDLLKLLDEITDNKPAQIVAAE